MRISCRSRHYVAQEWRIIMNENFRGWTSVYSFTFRQSTKGVGFKLVTVLITLIIIGAIIGVTILNAKPEEKEPVEISPITTVYVLDNSGLAPTGYKELNPELATEQFSKIKYINVTDQTRDAVIDTAEKAGDTAIAVIITTTDTGFAMEAVIPSGSMISQGQANALLTQMSTAFDASKLLQSGLTAEQLAAVMMPEVTSYSDVGENTSVIVQVIKVAAPMACSFMLYMMLLLYGQTISKSVSTEKTSKLMETLLTSVHPYALITGKVLAITSMALLQFIIWIASAFVGLYGGNAIAHSIYPEYQNSVITVINFFKDNIGDTALTPPAIIIAILIIFIGLLFYFVLAGLAGCMVSKPEDAASTQQLFILPIVISFLVVYLAPLSGNDSLLKIARFVPFTAPFCVPADLITGAIGLGQGLLAFAILFAFSLLVIMLSGRIYKGLILYNGQKPSFNMIGKILKGAN